MDDQLHALVKKREALRLQKKFSEADAIRDELEAKGYVIADTQDGVTVQPKAAQGRQSSPQTIGTVAIFGSGELSPPGRSIHDYLVSSFSAPVKISLLQTPAGYEANPHHWYKKLADMLQVGLQNYKPEISLLPALTREGEKSTNDPVTLAPLLTADYIHTGAGSPTYAARHLINTRAVELIGERVRQGSSFSLASAAAIAFGRFVLPVYEIYSAGEELHWQQGINFFAQWGLHFTVIPHWDNTEGGKDIDTRYGYMGEKRFHKLLTLLPEETTILGIDEHTALVMDLNTMTGKVMGKGNVTIFPNRNSKKKTSAKSADESFSLSVFTRD